MTRPDIHLYIDRLVLDGFNLSLREHQQLQTSIETELRRLLSERGLHTGLAQGISVPGVSVAPIRLDAKTSTQPQQLGQQIAASVYGGIGHEPTTP
jgi:hypothetical protein